MDREEVNAIGARLMAVRDLFDDDYIIVSIGARGPNIDCRNGNHVATVSNGNDEATSEALQLYDAICLARGKIDRRRALDAEKRAKEKAKAA